MGKGFNNYMTKKFFHPSSKDNIKRVWMAQQKTEFEKKKEEEMLNQYQKEQDMYENRALLGDEKAKLGLSFMYDAPPGLQKKEKEEGETEYKFEWQRKYNAPREQYAKNDDTILDQPFGIEVRNVRCIKCRKWGHVNTDRICPLFGKDLTAEPPQPKSSASSLLESMRDEGFTLNQSLLGKMTDPTANNEKILPSDDEDDPEVKFLKSLTLKQKKKLFKKLNKLQEGGSSGKTDKKKKKKKRKGHKHEKKRKTKDSSSESETDSSDDDRGKKKKMKREKVSESSGSSSEEDDKTIRKNGGVGKKGGNSHQPDLYDRDHERGRDYRQIDDRYSDRDRQVNRRRSRSMERHRNGADRNRSNSRDRYRSRSRSLDRGDRKNESVSRRDKEKYREKDSGRNENGHDRDRKRNSHRHRHEGHSSSEVSDTSDEGSRSHKKGHSRERNGSKLKKERERDDRQRSDNRRDRDSSRNEKKRHRHSSSSSSS